MIVAVRDAVPAVVIAPVRVTGPLIVVFPASEVLNAWLPVSPVILLFTKSNPICKGRSAR